MSDHSQHQFDSSIFDSEAPIDMDAFEAEHREEIEEGIARGLADVEAGRTYERTPEFRDQWIKKLQERYEKRTSNHIQAV